MREKRLALDDVVAAVRWALRFKEETIALRKRVACPCCSTTGEAFDPGPVWLEVPARWEAGLRRAEQVEAAVQRCVDAARAAGIEVVDE